MEVYNGVCVDYVIWLLWYFFINIVIEGDFDYVIGDLYCNYDYMVG